MVRLNHEVTTSKDLEICNTIEGGRMSFFIRVNILNP